MLPVEVVCIPGGGTAIDLTPRLTGGLSFSTAAVGGFADCTFTLEGDARRLLPYLALIRITYADKVLYEGQIEDASTSGTAADRRTTATVFGLRNLMVETSVRRTWAKRDFDWQVDRAGLGEAIAGSIVWPQNTGGGVNWTDDLQVTSGEIDATNLTKKGIRIQGKNVSIPYGFGAGAVVRTPLPMVYLGATLASSFAGGVGWTFRVYGWTWGSAGGVGVSINNFAVGANLIDLITSPNAIAIFAENLDGAFGAHTPAFNEVADFTDIRALFRSTEDATGGYYGGTILTDLIALVPGLTAGMIEDGSDFTIQAIDRSVRDTALAVAEEVSGYYTRELAVWENGRVDWKTRALDTADWIVMLADCADLEIHGTLDGIARTVYVLYNDAVSGIDAEASAVATANRNPYVKQGRAKDVLVNAGFPMTTNTSQQLATRIAGDIGQWVPVQGTVSIPATKLLQRQSGPAAPAATIRGGDNILLPELPKDEVFQSGRDGQTLFHVVGTHCDLQAGTITLELEGQANRTDVLLAKLAAVTRVLTG